MNKQSIASRAIILLLLVSMLSTLASAYTGSFAFSPPLPGGPDTKETTSAFDIDTETSNPQEIITDLNFIYKIIIETDPTFDGEFFSIKEYPGGADPAWDFIVPKKVNDALVKATVYFWADSSSPDTLPVIHQHSGEPDTTIYATRLYPEVSDGTGRVLYVFETTSFSSFFVNAIPVVSYDLPWVAISFLTFLSVLPGWLLRKR